MGLFEATFSGKSANIGRELQEFLERSVASEVLPTIRKWAMEDGKAAVTEHPGENYTIHIDGKLHDGVSSLAYVPISRKTKIRIHFYQEALKIAVGQFKQIFSSTAERGKADWKNLHAKGLDDLSQGVVVLYFKQSTQKMTRITNVQEVDTFEPGDYFMITSDNPYATYLNTRFDDGGFRIHSKTPGTASGKRHGKGGFFKKAAVAIQKELRLTKRKGSQSLIKVMAVRSKKIGNHLTRPAMTPAGAQNYDKLEHVWGFWGILIKYNARTQGMINRG